MMEHRIEVVGGRVQSSVAHDVEPDLALHEDAARLDRLLGGRWQPWTRDASRDRQACNRFHQLSGCQGSIIEPSILVIVPFEYARQE
jgi:hypothetical protein